jgi:4-hydroxythreonine-4-phosphate dehydrogenase
MHTDAPIAISMGDPSGIGPEIIAKAFLQNPQDMAGCVVVGDLATLRRAAAWVSGDGPRLPVAQLADWTDAANLTGSASGPVTALGMPVIDLVASKEAFAVGQINAASGLAAGRCVWWSTEAVLRGDAAALVTAPLHKASLALAGEPFAAFPGHTEMLQHLAAAHAGCALADMPVRMMLANDELRVVLVSIHLGLRRALDAVTQAQVLQTIQITHAALAAGLGRPPRIAVAGLNPHAGEGGLFGREEMDEIEPAVAAALAQHMQASGPFAPDTVFMRARTGEFDAVVAMYHDQGLIPVKYLGVEQGVNVTLGLHNGRGRPLVRTSPDHGTAFDLAGTGRANASSLVAAVRHARSLIAAA